MKFCDTLWISIIFRASNGGTYEVQDIIYLKISVTIIKNGITFRLKVSL